MRHSEHGNAEIKRQHYLGSDWSGLSFGPFSDVDQCRFFHPRTAETPAIMFSCAAQSWFHLVRKYGRYHRQKKLTLFLAVWRRGPTVKLPSRCGRVVWYPTGDLLSIPTLCCLTKACFQWDMMIGLWKIIQANIFSTMRKVCCKYRTTFTLSILQLCRYLETQAKEPRSSKGRKWNQNLRIWHQSGEGGTQKEGGCHAPKLLSSLKSIRALFLMGSEWKKKEQWWAKNSRRVWPSRYILQEWQGWVGPMCGV